jgi:hypothetical protein
MEQLTKLPIQSPPEDGHTILPKDVRSALFKARDGGDAIQLYVFYQDVAISQNSAFALAKNEFCMKKLHWGKDRLHHAKVILQRHKLIKIDQRRNEFGKTEPIRININWNPSIYQRVHRSPVLMPSDSNLKTENRNTSSGSPVASKAASGFGEIYIESSGVSLDTPPPLKKKEEKKRALTRENIPPNKVCPYGHIFGKEADHYRNDCDECDKKHPELYESCLQYTELDEKSISQ